MAEEKKSGRTYHVLKHHPDADAYDKVAEIEASGPSQAIRLCVVDYGGGTYAAIPDGNWTVETYSVEPQPPKITKVEPTAAVDMPPNAITSDPNLIPMGDEQHSVAVGEQETIDDDVDRAAIRREAAARKQ